MGILDGNSMNIDTTNNIPGKRPGGRNMINRITTKSKELTRNTRLTPLGIIARLRSDSRENTMNQPKIPPSTSST